jgi:mono/diheme cytochrome c family protein
LHANCAQCHVPAGGGNAQMNLLFSVGAKERNVNDIKPLHHTLGIANPRLVAPASAARSVLLARMARRGESQMPPLASRVVDEQGVDLIRRWIEEGAHE